MRCLLTPLELCVPDVRADLPDAFVRAVAPPDGDDVAKSSAKLSAKEKRQKRKEGGEDGEAVMEVDSIIGMRAKRGNVQYKVQWKDGTQTWEPYDNIMDDGMRLRHHSNPLVFYLPARC